MFAFTKDGGQSGDLAAPVSSTEPSSRRFLCPALYGASACTSQMDSHGTQLCSQMQASLIPHPTVLLWGGMLFK
eukprot:6465673-Amphidinium_carterae.2